MLYCLCTDRSIEGLRWPMASSSRGLKRISSSWFVVISCHQPHFLGLRFTEMPSWQMLCPRDPTAFPHDSDGARVFGAAARGKCLCCHPRQSDQFCNQGIFSGFQTSGGVNQFLESPPLPSLLPRHFSPLPSHSTPVLLPPLS